LGKGTLVTVKIPYQQGKQEHINKTVSETIIIPESLKKLTLLVADDEEYNRFLIKSILQKWGVKYNEAKNGNEVINATKTEKYDIILMDLNMPEMSGIEAALTIAEYNSEVIIIAITASNEQVDQLACINAGMKGFLLKPFSEHDLLDTLISVLPPEKQIINSNLSQQVNIDELARLANGDKKFLSEMILLFIKSSEAGILNMEEAIKNKNLESVFENAHKMAAPTKHIGAVQLYNNLKKLEKLAQQNGSIESVSPVFQQIKNEVTELNVILKSRLVEIET
jgi:CheY-like chemotaxis protein